MARDGVWKELDCALTWHPSHLNYVDSGTCNSCIQTEYAFKGLASHASAAPEYGRSALDALELMSVGVNFLREHMPDEARIHYAYIDSGGSAPNVVQDHALVRYEVRAPYVAQAKEIFERVKEVARGASIMTGTSYECELAMAFTEYIPNEALASIAYGCLSEIGAPKWDEEDFKLAKAYLESYGDEVKANIRSKMTKLYGEERLDELWERPLDGEIHHYDSGKIELQAGSTDVGDVGAAVPTLNILTACACVGNVGHSWQMTAQAASPIAHKGLLTAAKMLALCSLRTAERPDIIERAKAEVLKRNGGSYTCPLPDSVAPPLDTY